MLKTHTTARGLKALPAMILAVALLIPPQIALAAWSFEPSGALTQEWRESRPSVSGDNVAYEDYRNAHDVLSTDGDPIATLYDIYVYNTKEHTRRCLTPRHTAYGRPAISGNKIAWLDWGYGSIKSGIAVYDLAKLTTYRLPVDAWHDPDISGDKIVYEAFRGGHHSVYLFDLATKRERRLSALLGHAVSPAIWGNLVVWQDHRNGNWDIYSFDLGTGAETRLTSGPGNETSPRVSGSRVVYALEGASPTERDIYVYSVATHTSSKLTEVPIQTDEFADISGDRVVWSASKRIHVYDLALGLDNTVTASPELCSAPSIAGSLIAYEYLGVGQGEPDVYLAKIPSPVASAFSAPTVSYGAAATVIGMLKDANGSPLVGKDVVLQASANRSSWADVDSTQTLSGGLFGLRSSALGTTRFFRVRFAGDSDFPSCASNMLSVKPRVWATTPAVTSANVTLKTSFRITGYLKPRHAPGTYPVKIRFYHWERRSNGTYAYVYKKSVSAKASDYSTYTKYSASTALPYRGAWRMRVFHAADTRNAETFSGYRYITVR